MEQTIANQIAGDRSSGALAQRWIVTLHMAALAAQVVFALLFLGGRSEMVPLHSTNAWVVLGLGFAQGLSVVSSWPSGGKFWKSAAVLVVLAEATQMYLGRAGSLAAHVTLGIVLWGLSLALLIQVWAPSWGRRSLSATS
jgi:hypothetical protein